MTQPTSVLFSLQELARMEEERVRGLAAAAERERAAHECAERAAEERHRQEQVVRERAEARARHEVEQRAREEAARIEAIHRTAAEAARVEAQARAALEARELERRHELALEHSRLVARERVVGRPLLAALFGAMLATACVMVVHYAVAAPRERLRAATAESKLAGRDDAIADLHRQHDDDESRLRDLETALGSARADSDALKLELAALRRTAPRSTLPSGAGQQPHPGAPRLDGFTVCAPGSKDPLCLH
jgi:hypothetical protein